MKYFEIPSDTEGMANALIQIVNLDDKELLEYANQGDLVKQMFSGEVWLSTLEEIEIN